MTEYSYMWTTNGTGDGTATGYADTAWLNIMQVAAACAGKEGVAPFNNADSLLCYQNGANNLVVSIGGAMVDGRPYYTSTAVNVTIPSASASNTRIDRIVLRADWSAQTVRVTRIAGTETTGTPTAPSITQTSGTTYDIKLCQVLANASGLSSVTDERVWAVEGMMLIESYTGTGGTGTKTFSNIPQGFSRLRIEFVGFNDGAGSQILRLRLNGDSSANYTWDTTSVDNTGSPSGSQTTGATSIAVGAVDNGTAVIPAYIDIFKYTTSDCLVSVSVPKIGSMSWFVGRLTTLATAVSSVTLFMSADNFTTDTTIKLYGIK